MAPHRGMKMLDRRGDAILLIARRYDDGEKLERLRARAGARLGPVTDKSVPHEAAGTRDKHAHAARDA